MMLIAKVVEKLEIFFATTLLVIPDGAKFYKHYAIDKSRNNTTTGPRLYRDDCGAWRGSSHTASYLKQNSKQQLQKIALFNQNKKSTQVLKEFLPQLGIKTSYCCISTIVI